MSEKEYAMNLLDAIPKAMLGHVIAYMQGIMASDAQDDEFCEELIEEYKKDPDKGQFISFEEMARLSGVDVNEV